MNMKTGVKRKGNPNFGRPKAVVTESPITQETAVMEETIETPEVEQPQVQPQVEFLAYKHPEPIVKQEPRKNPSTSGYKPFKIEEDKVYEFELINSYPGAKPVEKHSGKPITSPYPPMHSEPNEGVAFDEDYDNGAGKTRGRARAWRLIDGQPSIWVDEQPSLENLEKQEIYNLLGQGENQLEFKEGKLMVRGIEKLKVQALMVQDAFEGKKVQYRNKPRRYRLNNPDIDVVTSIQKDELVYQAMKLAMEADTDEMLRGAYVLGIDITDQSESGMNRIKNAFIQKAKFDPANPKGLEFFTKIMLSPITKITYIFSQGLDKGLISSTQQQNKLTWAHINSAVLDIDSTKNIVEQLTAMAVGNDPKAMDLFDELEVQLNNL